MAEVIRLGRATTDWPRGERMDVPLHAADGARYAPTGETVSAINHGLPVRAGCFVTLWQADEGASFYVIAAECP